MSKVCKESFLVFLDNRDLCCWPRVRAKEVPEGKCNRKTHRLACHKARRPRSKVDFRGRLGQDNDLFLSQGMGRNLYGKVREEKESEHLYLMACGFLGHAEGDVTVWSDKFGTSLEP